jgi:hypothetical protein
MIFHKGFYNYINFGNKNNLDDEFRQYIYIFE